MQVTSGNIQETGSFHCHPHSAQRAIMWHGQHTDPALQFSWSGGPIQQHKRFFVYLPWARVQQVPLQHSHFYLILFGTSAGAVEVWQLWPLALVIEATFTCHCTLSNLLHCSLGAFRFPLDSFLCAFSSMLTLGFQHLWCHLTAKASVTDISILALCRLLTSRSIYSFSIH